MVGLLLEAGGYRGIRLCILEYLYLIVGETILSFYRVGINLPYLKELRVKAI